MTAARAQFAKTVHRGPMPAKMARAFDSFDRELEAAELKIAATRKTLIAHYTEEDIDTFVERIALTLAKPGAFDELCSRIDRLLADAKIPSVK
jgi:hypothetical protein